MIGLNDGAPSKRTATADLPVGTVLVHPKCSPGDPDACRIMKRSTVPGEWPWIRITGSPGRVPSRWDDLSDWTVQSLEHLARVLGHGELS